MYMRETGDSTLIAQIRAGKRLFCAQEFFGRTFEYDLTALAAALRTHVDDPVGVLDDV